MATVTMMAGILAFFAALITARRIKHRAFGALSDEHKLALLDSFSSQRDLRLVPLALLVLVYLGVSQLVPVSSPLITAVFWTGLLIFGISSMALDTLRLRRLPLPPQYLRAWLLGRGILLGGVLLMMAAMVFGSGA